MRTIDTSALKYYKIIGNISSVIAKETTIDGALKSGIQAIVNNSFVDYAVIWYFDNKDERLHPYYWMEPNDLTSLSYSRGEGIVGKVYAENRAIVNLDVVNTPCATQLGEFEKLNVSSVVCVPFSNELTGIGCVEFIKIDEKLDEEGADICQLLALLVETEIQENFQPGNWEDRCTIMSVKDIRKEYINGSVVTKVLKGVSFDVFDGEFLCLLGESGCGKSTILNIIGGMDQATSGSFSFMGIDYSKATEEELTEYRRKNIGFIFQSYNLMPNLNAKQNLDLIGELVDHPKDTDKLLNLVGMAEKASNYPSELSGGQQQRISIARALIKNPKIILADEPTAALDYATSIEVLSALEDVVANGTTLIMVTHNEEITRMADRVIRFRDGKLYEVNVNRKPAKAKDLVW